MERREFLRLATILGVAGGAAGGGLGWLIANAGKGAPRGRPAAAPTEAGWNDPLTKYHFPSDVNAAIDLGRGSVTLLRPWADKPDTSWKSHFFKIRPFQDMRGAKRVTGWNQMSVETASPVAANLDVVNVVAAGWSENRKRISLTGIARIPLEQNTFFGGLTKPHLNPVLLEGPSQAFRLSLVEEMAPVKTFEPEELSLRLDRMFPPASNGIASVIGFGGPWDGDSVAVLHRSLGGFSMADVDSLEVQRALYGEDLWERSEKGEKNWAWGIPEVNEPYFHQILNPMLEDDRKQAVMAAVSFRGDVTQVPVVPPGTHLRAEGIFFLNDPGSAEPSELNLDSLNTNNGWPVVRAVIMEYPRQSVSPDGARQGKITNETNLPRTYVPKEGSRIYLPLQSVVPIRAETNWYASER